MTILKEIFSSIEYCLYNYNNITDYFSFVYVVKTVKILRLTKFIWLIVLVQEMSAAKTAESKLHDNLGKLQVTSLSFFLSFFYYFNYWTKA